MENNKIFNKKNYYANPKFQISPKASDSMEKS